MKTGQSAYRVIAIYLALGLLVSSVQAAKLEYQHLKVDDQQVTTWNRFAARLYTLHQAMLSRYETYTKTRQGGFAHQPDIYTETRYYDKHSKRLLSVIQRMNDNPELIEEIAVNIYNAHGQIIRDYLVAYLPYNRNAPIQTLINLHAYHGQLHGFRQFDASGVRIYEQCKGVYQGQAVMISLEEDELEGAYQSTKVLGSAVYQACFNGIPETAKDYLNPEREIKLLKN